MENRQIKIKIFEKIQKVQKNPKKSRVLALKLDKNSLFYEQMKIATFWREKSKFLKFFEVDLSNSGIYSLHVSGNVNGTQGIANEMDSASGLPDNLDYAMGIIFIGSGDSGPLLDILFDPNERAAKGKDQLLTYG